MASPETGTGLTTSGNWVVVQPGLPDVFQDVADILNSLVSALLAVLNVALAILQVVKAFLVGLLDPIVAIINAIINEIEGFIQDIKNIGIYISHDGPLLKPDYEYMLGGFGAYERRMITRLVDNSDPTRPDFSSRTAVIGIFLYASADVSSIASLVRVIKSILNFFGQTVPVASYTAPVGLEAVYGTEGGVFAPLTTSLAQSQRPDVVNIRWRLAPPSSGTQAKLPRVAPKGFLIEVSTIREGLTLAFDAPAANAQPNSDRVYGLVRDPKTGLPFRLYGGKDVIDAGDLEDPDFSTGDTTQTRLYGYRSSSDNVPIPLDALKQDRKYVLQRAFFLKTNYFRGLGPGQGYSAKLSAEDMPYNAEFSVNGSGKVEVDLEPEPATNLFVRVSAVTEDIADLVSGTGVVPATDLGYWTIDSTTIAAGKELGKVQLGTRTQAQGGDKSEPSQALEVTFPGGDTQTFLDTIVVALAVMLLSRSDLPTVDTEVIPPPFQVGRAALATGIEEIAQKLVDRIVDDRRAYFHRNNVSPETFRMDLLQRCRNFATKVYRSNRTSAVIEEAAVEAGAALLAFKWANENALLPDATIVETLESSNPKIGVGLNPLCIGLGVETAEKEYTFFGATVPRAPHFMEKANADRARWQWGMGSMDNSPVIYNRVDRSFTEIQFCRNVFPTEVYEAAQTVLGIVAGSFLMPELPAGTGRWAAFRLFPQGLPALEKALDQILRFVQSIRDGLSSVVDVILAYIEFLEARIIELQALIIRINALIQSIALFDLPRMAGLVVTGSGTDGLLQGLVTAGDKPSDSPLAYGGGVVIVAGGLPAVLIELLQALFPEAD